VIALAIHPYVEYGDFGQVLQHLPFTPNVINGANNNDVFELVIVKVRGTEWHH